MGVLSVGMHLCLLRCAAFQLHLCLLDLGIGVCTVFVLILGNIAVCLLWAHSVLLLIAVVRLPEPGTGAIRGRAHKQTERWGCLSAAGERAGVPIELRGIPQESLILVGRAHLNQTLTGFSLWTMSWAVAQGAYGTCSHCPVLRHWCQLQLQWTISSCTIPLATEDFTPVQDGHSRASCFTPLSPCRLLL